MHEIDGFTLAMGLFGGLALFLYGMDQMTEALKRIAGSRMKSLLALLTTNRFTGALTGALVTAVIQSSSVTTVLLVGFITAGLMSLSQSVGVIMGANIGTTITAQIIAFKVTKYALLLISIGFAMLFASKRERIRSYGRAIMGIGLVFFGMAVMGEAMAPLRESTLFQEFVLEMERPWLGILAGALFTSLVQSSSATTGIVIVMASQGLIGLSAGIALIFGSNVGTCVTALLASIGKPREALRASLVHVLFNVAGVVLWIGLIDQLAEFVTWASPSSPELSGTARLAAETPRQIANAHTAFNVVNTFVFIGFAGLFAKLATRLAPDRTPDEERMIRAKYLDDELISTPSLALDRARMEILHLGDRVQGMYRTVLEAAMCGETEALNAIEKADDDVDSLHGWIVMYLGKIGQGSLNEQQTGEFLHLMETANHLENIGDLMETNFVALGRRRIQRHLEISQETKQVLRGLHQTVGRALDLSLQAVAQRSVEAAEQVIGMKPMINEEFDAAVAHEAKRLVADEPNRLEAYTVEVDMLENLKRIYYFAKRAARSVVDESKEIHV